MKKTLILLLTLVFVLAMLTACAGEAEPAVADATAAPAATATPVPTQAPIIMVEAPDPTPEPQDNAEITDGLSGLIISDADVDYVMLDIIGAWPGYSVFDVYYDGKTVYYIIPEENSVDESKAIGAVDMTYDPNKVHTVSCQIFLGKREANAAQLETLYNYFRDTFAFETIHGVTESSWKLLLSMVDMNYEKAVESSLSGMESRELFGQFVYHIAPEVVSFDFYAS